MHVGSRIYTKPDLSDASYILLVLTLLHLPLETLDELRDPARIAVDLT